MTPSHGLARLARLRHRDDGVPPGVSLLEVQSVVQNLLRLGNPAPGVEGAHARRQVRPAQVPRRALHVPLVDPCAAGVSKHCPWSASQHLAPPVKPASGT